MFFMLVLISSLVYSQEDCECSSGGGNCEVGPIGDEECMSQQVEEDIPDGGYYSCDPDCCGFGYCTFHCPEGKVMVGGVSCVEEGSEPTCGNGVIDGEEDCDPGLEGDEAKAQCLGGAGECIQCSCVYGGENEDEKCNCLGRENCKSWQYCKFGTNCKHVDFGDYTKKGLCTECSGLGDYSKECVSCESSGGKIYLDKTKNGASCKEGGKAGVCKDGYCIPKCTNPEKLGGELACVPNSGSNSDRGKCINGEWDIGKDNKGNPTGCKTIIEQYFKNQLRGITPSNYIWGCKEDNGEPKCYYSFLERSGWTLWLHRSEGQPNFVEVKDKDYFAGVYTPKQSIYLTRQTGCYTPNGYAYQLISNIKEFNLPVLKMFYSHKDCDDEITIDKVVVKRYEDSGLLTNEVLKSCNVQYNAEETIIINPEGGDYEVLCSSGVCHARLEVPFGAVNEVTTLTIKEIMLSDCSCGDGVCGLTETSSTCSTDCLSCETDYDCGMSCSDKVNFYQTGKCTENTCRNLVYNNSCFPENILMLFNVSMQDLRGDIGLYERKQLSKDGLLRITGGWIRGYETVVY